MDDLLARRLSLLGLRDVDRIRTHTNRTVMVSLSRGGCCGSTAATPAPPTGCSAPSSASSTPRCPARFAGSPSGSFWRFPVEEHAPPPAPPPARASAPRRPAAAPPADRSSTSVSTPPTSAARSASHPDPSLRPDADPARRAERGPPHRAAARDRDQPPAPHAAPVARSRAHDAARDGAPVAGRDAASGWTTAPPSGERRAAGRGAAAGRARRSGVRRSAAEGVIRGEIAFARILAAHAGGDMRWTPGGSAADVEDRRGQGGRFGGGGMRIGLGGCVVLLVLSLVFKQNFFSLLGGGGAPAADPSASTAAGPVADHARRRRAERVRHLRPQRRPGHLDQASRPRQAVRARQARALPRRHPDGVRRRPGRGGALLLPRRQPGLHRPRLLRRAARALRRRRATSPRPT